MKVSGISDHTHRHEMERRKEAEHLVNVVIHRC